MLIQSIWDITFDPDGTPFVLAEVGDFLTEEPAIGTSQEVERVAYIEGEFPAHYPREQKDYGITIVVTKDHATLAAAAAWRLTHLAAVPWTTRAELEMDSTALSLTQRMATATIQSVEISLPTDGLPRTRTSYVIVGQPFTLYEAP